MPRLILFLVFLIASVWLGLEILRHPGYLLLVYQPWMVQMPIWFAALSLFVIFILFYFLIDSIDRLQFLCFRFKNWLHFRRTTRSYSKTQHGLALLVEGRYAKAEKLLLAGREQAPEPLMNYLAAAYAAHEQGIFHRRDDYLRKAYQVAPEAELAIGLTEAELQFAQGRFEQAIALLNRLKRLAPKHPRILKMLEKIYVRLSDWVNLKNMLPDLRRAKIIDDVQYTQFSHHVYSEIVRTSVAKTLTDWHAFWQSLPRDARKNPQVIHAYVQRLLALNADHLEIQDLIRHVLKSTWHAELALIYGTLTLARPEKQLVIAGAWLRIHGEQPELYFTLARLCVHTQLWGKAKDYFEKCLALSPNAQASLEYGELLERLGERDEALAVFRRGLRGGV